MADDQNLNRAIAQIERAQADKCLRPSIAGFFDEATNTVSYVVHDPKTDEAALIDSVLYFEAASGRTSNGAADRVVEYITSNNLKVVWHIETRSEEHTSELQSLIRISYAVFCLTNKTKQATTSRVYITQIHVYT